MSRERSPSCFKKKNKKKTSSLGRDFALDILPSLPHHRIFSLCFTFPIAYKCSFISPTLKKNLKSLSSALSFWLSLQLSAAAFLYVLNLAFVFLF